MKITEAAPIERPEPRTPPASVHSLAAVHDVWKRRESRRGDLQSPGGRPILEGEYQLAVTNYQRGTDMKITTKGVKPIERSQVTREAHPMAAEIKANIASFNDGVTRRVELAADDPKINTVMGWIRDAAASLTPPRGVSIAVEDDKGNVVSDSKAQKDCRVFRFELIEKRERKAKDGEAAAATA